jgi:hypothetical protein
MKVCAYRDCEEEFEPSRRNQKYHTPECCKFEMNARAKDAWAEKRERRKGKKRVCKSCGTKLSSYNDGKICGACEQRPKVEQKKRALEIAKNGK